MFLLELFDCVRLSCEFVCCIVVVWWCVTGYLWCLFGLLPLVFGELFRLFV